METDYPIDVRLRDLSVRDLPLNRRQQLSAYLNPEQILPADCGLARDYRGIAQQLDLSYAEISKLEKLIDPFGSLLSYQIVARKSVCDLLRMAQAIGRFDLLDDMMPSFVRDLDQLEQRQQQNDKFDGHTATTRKDQLLIYRPAEEEEPKIWYDAYVCYADEDLDFVRKLATVLESESPRRNPLRLFIRDRDLLGGNWVYESFAQLIESQCRRVIIILSPDFLTCADCAFQSQFATGLAIEKRSRILIPVIYRACALPPIIRLLSKIDMTAEGGDKLNADSWPMNRLIRSIQDYQQHQHHHQAPAINQPQILAPPPAQPSSSSSSSSQNTIENNNNNNNNSTDNINSPIIELASEEFCPGTPQTASSTGSNPWTKNSLETTISTLSIGDNRPLLQAECDHLPPPTSRMIKNAEIDPMDQSDAQAKYSTNNNNNANSNNSNNNAKKDRTWYSSIKRKIKIIL